MRAFLILLAAGLTLSVPAAASAAEQFAGLTDDNHLVLFRSDSPGNLQGSAPITGIQSGEKLVGLGWLDTIGRLYALGSSNRVYIVNPVTGAATPLSSVPFAPPLNGTTFTFAIDPMTQLARTYSSTNQDLRISVANGQVAGVDAPYAYDPSDPGAGTTPVLAALAYAQPPAGGGSSTLYGIDTERDALVTAPTQAALVRTLGALNVDATGSAALAIVTTTPSAATTTAPTTAAFAALSPGTGETPRLYTVDLATGAASPVSGDDARATIAYRTSSRATTDTPIIAMTALGSAADDDAKPRTVVAASSAPKAATLLRSGLPFTTSCDEACSVSGTLKIGKRSLKAVTGSVLATAGSVKLTAKLDAAAKKALRADATQGMSLKVTATDAAGNKTTITVNGATR